MGAVNAGVIRRRQIAARSTWIVYGDAVYGPYADDSHAAQVAKVQGCGSYETYSSRETALVASGENALDNG